MQTTCCKVTNVFFAYSQMNKLTMPLAIIHWITIWMFSCYSLASRAWNSWFQKSILNVDSSHQKTFCNLVAVHLRWAWARGQLYFWLLLVSFTTVPLLCWNSMQLRDIISATWGIKVRSVQRWFLPCVHSDFSDSPKLFFWNYWLMVKSQNSLELHIEGWATTYCWLTSLCVDCSNSTFPVFAPVPACLKYVASMCFRIRLIYKNQLI